MRHGVFFRDREFSLTIHMIPVDRFTGIAGPVFYGQKKKPFHQAPTEMTVMILRM